MKLHRLVSYDCEPFLTPILECTAAVAAAQMCSKRDAAHLFQQQILSAGHVCVCVCVISSVAKASLQTECMTYAGTTNAPNAFAMPKPHTPEILSTKTCLWLYIEETTSKKFPRLQVKNSFGLFENICIFRQLTVRYVFLKYVLYMYINEVYYKPNTYLQIR